MQPNVKYDPPVLGFEFNADNQWEDLWEDLPEVNAKQLFAKETYGTTGVCLPTYKTPVGRSYLVNDGSPLVYLVERNADSSAFKEFTVTIKDTSDGNWGGSKPCNASEDGQTPIY